MAQAPTRAEYRGVIQFTAKILISRPQGGTPVTGQVIRTENPDDPVLADWKPQTPVTISVYEIATGVLVRHWHDKLDKAKDALRAMKAGTWVRFPKVARRSAADPARVGD